MSQLVRLWPVFGYRTAPYQRACRQPHHGGREGMTRIAVAVCALTLLACTSSPEPGGQGQSQVETISVSGRVTVTGSEPHVMLVIVTDEVYYELVGEVAEELWKLQQRQVTVRGRIVRPALGPGFPARLAVDGYAS